MPRLPGKPTLTPCIATKEIAMPMTIDDLTVAFDANDRDTLLADWRWLTGPDKHLILIAASGDAFLQDARDGTIHRLETVAGELEEVAADIEEFRELLNDREFVAGSFAVQMVGDLREGGLVLRPGTVYSFKHPPALGGAFEPDNVEACDIAVHFATTGQIHRQLSKG
jgi:hypothetical protein